MNKLYGIIISSIAGLSTLIGYLFIYVKGDINKILYRCLSFASGTMISISIIDLLPSSIKKLNSIYDYRLSILFSFIFFWIGFFICHIVSNIIKFDDKKLYKVGLITMIGIMLHNIPEGIATFVLGSTNLKLGILFAIAVVLHNIPEGISISIPIYYSTKNKFNAFIYTFISGLAEPIGAFLTLLFLYKYISNSIIGLLFSFISGLMIYIGYFELFRASLSYGKKKATLLYSMIGVLVIVITELLLKK